MSIRVDEENQDQTQEEPAPDEENQGQAQKI